MNDLRYALSLMGRYYWRQLGALLLQSSAEAICLNIAVGLVMREVINAAVNGDVQLLWRGAALLLAIYLMGVPLNLWAIYLIETGVPRIVNDLRLRFVAHAVTLPMARLEREHSGELLSRATNDVEGLRNLFQHDMAHLSFAVIVGMVGFIATLALSPIMAGVMLINGAITVVSNVWMARRIRTWSDKMQQRQGALNEHLSDLLQSLPVAKLFHLGPAVLQRFVQHNRAYSEARIGSGRWSSGLGVLNGMRMVFLNPFITLAVGLWLVSQGQLDLGAVVAIGLFEEKTSILFQNIGEFIANIQRSLSCATRVREILELPAERSAVDAIQPDAMPTPPAAIEMQGISFGYGPDALVLQDIDLTVPHGSVVALVGPSGGGKSTLLKLLLGFYPVETGRVQLNGVAMGSLSLDTLRAQSAYVPQDPFLFDATIQENLRYGRPNASHAEIEAAARIAHAHEFIQEIPGGYAARVGERGVQLSGGQRQRIALARAILKDAPLLLLDEATSALDTESERLVQEALMALQRGRTTLLIAHRLSTAQSADMICVMEGGRIVERGTPNELMERGGQYRRLVEAGFR